MHVSLAYPSTLAAFLVTSTLAVGFSATQGITFTPRDWDAQACDVSLNSSITLLGLLTNHGPHARRLPTSLARMSKTDKRVSRQILPALSRPESLWYKPTPLRRILSWLHRHQRSIQVQCQVGVRVIREPVRRNSHWSPKQRQYQYI